MTIRCVKSKPIFRMCSSVVLSEKSILNSPQKKEKKSLNINNLKTIGRAFFLFSSDTFKSVPVNFYARENLSI